MTANYRLAGVIVSALVAMNPDVGVGQTVVDADQYFGSDSPPEIYIELADDEILAFEEAKNDRYCLDGRALEIVARSIKMSGAVRVSSFCGTQGQGADQVVAGSAGAHRAKAGTGCGEYDRHGCHGEAGGEGGEGIEGSPGKPARWIRLRVRQIVGQGTVEFGVSGGKGGRGGRGGRGGNGGEGGNGKDRTCKTSCGHAGIGGDCGKGGPGGIGGTGGSGGRIEYESSLETFVASGKLRFGVVAAIGGPGGLGGEHGDPGRPGTAGGGNECGGGCSGDEDKRHGRCGPSYSGISREDQLGPSGSEGVAVQIDP